jgi:hypothetical protein
LLVRWRRFARIRSLGAQRGKQNVPKGVVEVGRLAAFHADPDYTADSAHFRCRFFVRTDLVRTKTHVGRSRRKRPGFAGAGRGYWSDPPRRRTTSCACVHSSSYLARKAPLHVIFQNDCSCCMDSFFFCGFSSEYPTPRLK